MDVTLLDKKGDKISFLVKGITPTLANTIRRAIIEEVPTLAIEDVEFRKNSSILYDETVAHRLGMVPLKTNLKGYNYYKECKCNGEGCARCQTTLTLKTGKTGFVLSGELKAKDKDVVPVHEEIPITKLLKGQSLELEATAVMGKGKEHSKWSPGHVFYYNEAKITVNNDDKLLEENKDKYPSSIFDKNGKVDKSLINSAELIDACDNVSKLIQIERNPDNFVFVLESWGQLPPKTIVLEAVEQIKKQLDEVSGLMK